MSRTAESTIKGFLYQFHKSINEILQLENGEIITLEGIIEDIDLTEYVYRILYQWGQGDYVQREIRELTDEEKERFNKQLIDEIDIEE